MSGGEGDPLLERREQRLSPWVGLVSKVVRLPGEQMPQEYHALSQADYVTVVATDERGRIPLVRQYRPALERAVLELPGGLLEPGEDPASCATRELFEETGLRAVSEPVALGQLDADSGRLENAVWCFRIARAAADPAWNPESGVEPVFVTPDELTELVRSGAFRHALHLGVLHLALLSGSLEGDGQEDEPR